MQRRAVSLKLEYIEQALIEAEAAARWYAERSATAAVRFSIELDEAEAAIREQPEAWPRSPAERGGICCGGFHSASSTAPSRPVSSSSPLRTPVADQATGELGPEPV